MEAVIVVLGRKDAAGSLLEQALRALTHIIFADAGNREKAGRFGGMEALIAALTRKDAAESVQTACWSKRAGQFKTWLLMMALKLEKAAERGGVEVVINVLRRKDAAESCRLPAGNACKVLILMTVDGGHHRRISSRDATVRQRQGGSYPTTAARQ